MRDGSVLLNIIPLVFVSLSFTQLAREVHGGNGIILPPPPPTKIEAVTETLHGKQITDAYRWLEDGHSAETRVWIDAQMAYTGKYLAQVKVRPEIVKRLTELERIESVSVPIERRGKFFFTRRLPDENQPSIYLRDGIAGRDERLIDPAKLTTDQNTSVDIAEISDDGSLLVYRVRVGGADESSLHIFDVAKHRDLADTLPSARYGRVSFGSDGRGFYYSRTDATGSTVYYHELGAGGSDEMIFGRKVGDEVLGPMELVDARVTENGRYLIIAVRHGVPAKRVDIYARDLRTPGSPIRPIIHGIDSRFEVVNFADTLYVLTDYRAPNYRVVKLNIENPAPDRWQTIVPEGKDVVSKIDILGGKLFVTGLHNVITETRVFALNGEPLGTLAYPMAVGSGTDLRGREDSPIGFYRFESFNLPPAIYRYDVATGKSEVFTKPKVKFDPGEYEVQQVFYTSKDGTRVPMFISAKKGFKQDGRGRGLMFAYGGFLLPTEPTWEPEYAWWMEQGGVFAQPSLRGGGEYGEAWHRAGMFQNKQNVFDDFYSAAEYLIANKYTSPEHLAIRGRSNGGLLMGAAMTQRPDLFGAIWCGYPLLDMLRFQKFLVGRWWTSEYGSSDNPDQFEYLLKYSPYQNVRPGTKYPAIMFSTGDSDTRVAPLHARKMTALMQASTGSNRPILLHYETKAGHSSGVSVEQSINDFADELSFLWNETGKD